jgi:hypothetical protein
VEGGVWDDLGPVGWWDGHSTICEVSGVSFSSFNPRAEFTFGPKANDDSYKLTGFMRLAASSNGIDPINETVTVKLGSFSATIPAHSFVQEGQSYSYKGPIGPSMLDVRIAPLAHPGTYSFKSCLKNGNLEGSALPLNVELRVGDDQGEAGLDTGAGKFEKGKDGKTPGSTCSSIKADNPQARDGVYAVDPDGSGGVIPFIVFCDMTTLGGGWTIIFNSNKPALWGSNTNPLNLSEWFFLACPNVLQCFL